MEKVSLGFDLDENKDRAAFKVSGAGAGAGFWVALIFMGLFLGGLFALIAGAVGFLASMGIALVICIITQNAKAGFYKFEVLEDHIKAGDKQYAKTDISELLIRNGRTEVTSTPAVSSGGIMVGGTGVAGVAIAGAAVASNAANQIGAAAGKAMSQSLQERNYQLAFRHGAKVIPLAMNLTQGVAISMLNELQRVY